MNNTETPKRIAFVIPSLGDGGSNRFMINVATGMASRGYDVDLISIDPAGYYAGKDLGRVRRIDIGSINVKGLTALRTVLTLARYIKRDKPASIMSATTAVNILLLLSSRLASKRTKVIVSERNSIRASAVDVSRMSRIYRKLISRFYPDADRVIAVSQGVADELVQDFNIPVNRVEVVYNPVVSDRLIASSREPVDDDWFADNQKPVVLSVGRLHPQKGFPTLIRAFAALRETMDARLVVLGEGRCRSELQALISDLGLGDSVRLLGFVDNPYAYMTRAKLFAIASKYEGICNVVIEALACGCPVVATDCPGGGPREILENGAWGRLVPVDDIQSLSQAMLQTLNSPPPAEELIKRASCFSYDAGMAKYENIFFPRL